MTILTDWRQQPIAVGAVIVYPTTASSSITMNEAVVGEIYFDPQTRYHWGDADPITKQRARTSYIEQVPRLRVRKTIEHLYGANNNTADATKLMKIERVDRVTVVVPRDEERCNHLGCTADLDHDDPTNPYCWPAHSWERDSDA